MPGKPSKYRAPALDKGLDILELLSRAAEPLTMTAVAAAIGYSKGEIFRMLQVLEERGYITRANDSGYELTNRLFLLGMERPRVKSLVEAALPAMHRLGREIGQPCHLAVASGDQIVVIARIDPPGDLGFVVRVGHRLPLSRSTSGAVLFAFQAEDVREHWLAQMDAAGTLYRRRQFLAQADAIRAQGHAALPSNDVDAVTDLSAPIMRHGAAAGALTIPYVERHPGRSAMKQAVASLKATVEAISKELTA
ncbi:MAG TPA: IclR family transcriptional regulator [Rhodanobacteraceae bacterium]|nr:IclR family transcriptional regulator [Rhodanobacteraceae bacterium]